MISERLMYGGLLFASYVAGKQIETEPNKIAEVAADAAIHREDSFLMFEDLPLIGDDLTRREEVATALAELIKKLSK